MSKIDPQKAWQDSVTALNSGDRDRALALIRQAARRLGDKPHVQAQLGDALTYNHNYWLNPELSASLVKDGTLEEAVAAWGRAFELGHEHHWQRFGMGHALTALGRFDEAVPHLRMATDLKAVRDNPQVADVYDDAPLSGPDFLIIGATKCGTTSLYEYMCRHPRILPAIWKEPEFFRFPERGLDWYLSHLPRTPQAPIRYLTGEASSCYLSLWEAKDLVHEHFPAAKLIVLARDPVDKAISHCHHDRKIGCEHRTVDEALNRELDLLEALDDPFHGAEGYWETERGYVWLGLYAYMLENWLTRFSKQQVMMIPSEDLWLRPESTLTYVFEHVGVDDHKLEEYSVHLEGAYDKSRPEPVRERLKRFFRPHNERLFDLLGRRLDWQ